jgi:hypothetical protein
VEVRARIFDSVSGENTLDVFCIYIVFFIRIFITLIMSHEQYQIETPRVWTVTSSSLVAGRTSSTLHWSIRPELPNNSHMTVTLSGVSTCMKPLWGLFSAATSTVPLACAARESVPAYATRAGDRNAQAFGDRAASRCGCTQLCPRPERPIRSIAQVLWEVWFSALFYVACTESSMLSRSEGRVRLGTRPFLRVRLQCSPLTIPIGPVNARAKPL